MSKRNIKKLSKRSKKQKNNYKIKNENIKKENRKMSMTKKVEKK